MAEDNNQQKSFMIKTFHTYGDAGTYALNGRQSFGRQGGNADIAVPSWLVSARHGVFEVRDDHLFYTDTGSTNGTWLNGRIVNGIVALKPGDELAVAPRGMGVNDKGFWMIVADRHPLDAEKIATVVDPDVTETVKLTQTQIKALLALFDKREETKGQAIAPQTEKMVPEKPVRCFDPELPGLKIDIEERSVRSGRMRRTLLKDIRLSVDPGDFVLILGGSGAGKSTFMKAVMGYEMAKGTITYGDLDVYADYDQMKYQIGFVSQKDLLRESDTVYDTLMSAAQMKMPDHVSKEALCERIEDALNILGISDERDNLVGRLSGGQKKRLSIAGELVGDPALFFLDEPDSGLDGILARELMENLRMIADLGKIVLIITHGPDRAIDLFTKVLVLGKSESDGSGHKVFYGTPEEAKKFFDVNSLEEIVRKVSRRAEGGEGLTDEYMARFAQLTDGGKIL